MATFALACSVLLALSIYGEWGRADPWFGTKPPAAASDAAGQRADAFVAGVDAVVTSITVLGWMLLLRWWRIAQWFAATAFSYSALILVLLVVTQDKEFGGWGARLGSLAVLGGAAACWLAIWTEARRRCGTFHGSVLVAILFVLAVALVSAVQGALLSGGDTSLAGKVVLLGTAIILVRVTFAVSGRVYRSVEDQQCEGVGTEVRSP